MLRASQCQNTHCNLPKVAAIYAIKHVFNIPEPHCVCVFLSLTLSVSWLYIYLCICMCVSVKCPCREAALSLFTGGSSLPLRDRPAGNGSLHWPTSPKKSQARSRGAKVLTLTAYCHCTISHPPTVLHCPTHARSQAQSQSGGERERPSVQQQPGLTVGSGPGIQEGAVSLP